MAKKFEFNANGFDQFQNVEKVDNSNIPIVTDIKDIKSNMVVQIPMDLIDIGENIRDMDANDELALSELGSSIKAYGQIEPCVVYPKDGRFVVKVGSRRYRACLDADIPTLKCIVEKGFSDEIDRIIKQAIENEHRKDMSPREREAYMAQLLNMGMTQMEIAKALHKGKGWVSEALSAYRIREQNKDLFAGLLEEPCTRDVYTVGKLKRPEIKKIIDEANENGGTKREFKRALAKSAELQKRIFKLRYWQNDTKKEIKVDIDLNASELDLLLSKTLKQYFVEKGYTIAPDIQTPANDE